jgi:hypothetical protein
MNDANRWTGPPPPILHDGDRPSPYSYFFLSFFLSFLVFFAFFAMTVLPSCRPGGGRDRPPCNETGNPVFNAK